MRKLRTIPVSLTIAGSDIGGGAGIQADLKTFAALGVHGTSVVTCITAQNPRSVLAIQACGPEIVRKQIEAVFSGLHPAAVKTGMLCTAEIIRVVAGFFKRSNPPLSLRSTPARPPLIVDPVMISTSGARLLNPSAVDLLEAELLPLATLVTPNLPEAETLIGRRLKSVEDLRVAAREIHRRFGCATLVKGGHLPNYREAADIFYDGKNELLLTAPFIHRVKTHGTGCTYSAAIAGFLALGLRLPEAVASAKEHVTQAIARSRLAGGHPVLNNSWS